MERQERHLEYPEGRQERRLEYPEGRQERRLEHPEEQTPTLRSSNLQGTAGLPLCKAC